MHPFSRGFRSKLLHLGLSGLLCFTCNLTSPANASDDRYADMRQHWEEQFGQSSNAQERERLVAELFHTLDTDRDGIDLKDIDFYTQIGLAAKRVRIFGEYLKFDLNGDHTIDRRETEIFVRRAQKRRNVLTPEEVEFVVKQILDRVFDRDPNDDGKISLSELAAITLERTSGDNHLETRLLVLAKGLLALDPNEDQKLEFVEAQATLQKVFTTEKTESASSAQEHTSPLCTVPKATSGAEVLLVGAYEGSSVPSVTVASQERETSTGTIRIEPGQSSLYLLLVSSNPMIWQFEGATERLEHVAVSGRETKLGKIKAGVIGLDRSRVSFVSATECILPFSSVGEAHELRARVSVARLVGKNTSSTHAEYNLHELSLPSGTARTAERKRPEGNTTKITVRSVSASAAPFEQSKAIKNLISQPVSIEVFSSLYHYNQGGVVSMNKEDVVSDATAEDYDVLPQKAGLAQLVAERKLEHIGLSQYRILSEIRFPASLSGALSAKFILGQSVPEPKGDPGHSCVFSEKAGGFIIGQVCHRR